MSLFVLSNWGFCILTSLLLLFIYAKHRFLLIKPSIVFLLFFHVRVQWGGTLRADFVESYLPGPMAYLILLNIFPFVALACSFFTVRRSMRRTWQRLTKEEFPINQRVLFLLLGGAVLITLYYLSHVSPTETGLFTILFGDPLRASQAREESLKLLDSPFVKYAFSFLRMGFAPLLSVMVAHWFFLSCKKKSWRQGLMAFAVLLFLLLVVSLPGARGPAAYLILVIILSRFLKKGLPLRPGRLFAAMVVVLAIPTLLTLLREGRSIDLGVSLTYLSAMFARAFAIPAEVAFWYLHYAQTAGFFGVAGVPKLAWLFDVTPMVVDNLIGLTYAVNPGNSISADTCFVFSYYSCFGLISVFFSLGALLLLDWIAGACQFVSNTLLTPLVASLLLSAQTLVEGDYTTVFLTNGFVVMIVIALFVDQFARMRISGPVLENALQCDQR